MGQDSILCVILRTLERILVDFRRECSLSNPICPGGEIFLCLINVDHRSSGKDTFQMTAALGVINSAFSKSQRFFMHSAEKGNRLHTEHYGLQCWPGRQADEGDHRLDPIGSAGAAAAIKGGSASHHQHRTM